MPQDPIGGVIQNLLLLQRLGNTANADVQPLIEGLFDEIVAAVAKLDPTSPPQETYRRQRLEAFVGEVESLAGGTFEDVRKTLRERMVDIGLLQAKWAEGQLERALGSVAVDIKSGRLGVNAMKAIIDSQPFEGFLLSEWAEGQSELVVKRVHREVQFGMAQHETLDDIIRRIRGRATGAPTRDEDGRITGYRFSGGVLETTTRETEALARTAVAFIANEGQVATWTENADILKALEVVATLDERTTEICMAKDGLTTDPADPDPDLIPPFHFRCRTVTVPVVDWEGLGIEPPPEGKRASRNGPVPGDWTYEDWLKQQSPALQDEILGPGRAKLFRDGKLSLRDLIRDDNELVPLEELRKS